VSPTALIRTVVRLSLLTTLSWSSPSRGPTGTSLVIPRIVLVIGADGQPCNLGWSPHDLEAQLETAAERAPRPTDRFGRGDSIGVRRRIRETFALDADGARAAPLRRHVDEARQVPLEGHRSPGGGPLRCLAMMMSASPAAR